MSKFLSHLRNLIIPFLLLLLIVAAAFGIYDAIWGWTRFKADFIPLDTSRVGPNLCASLFLVVLLVAHNEFVVAEKAEKLHEDHRKATEDVLRELLHPTDQAEADIAEQVEAQWRQQVLDGLDETTPGGIGTVVKKLEELKPSPKLIPTPSKRTTPKKTS